MTAIRWPCKKCGAEVGMRCTNYKGVICAPHAGRKPREPKPGRKRHAWGPPAPRSVQGSLFNDTTAQAPTL